MKNKVLVDLIKEKSIIIPLYLYKLKDRIGLTLDEFFFIMYLYNDGNLILFDLSKMELDLGMKMDTLMNLIGSLTDKKLIDVKVIKNSKDIMEEYISLDNFYDKVSLLLMDTTSVNNDDRKNVFSLIEQEFGRTLSPMEYEIIGAWIEAGNSVEVISCAIKEATMNGVSNLRYIDKVLYDWGKKGVKTKEDVEKLQSKYRKREETKAKVDVFDYDWLDDDES